MKEHTPREHITVITAVEREIGTVSIQEKYLQKAFEAHYSAPLDVERVVTVSYPDIVRQLLQNDSAAAFDFRAPEVFSEQSPRTRISYVYNLVPLGVKMPTPILPRVPIVVEEAITLEADARNRLHLYHEQRDKGGKVYKDAITAVLLENEHEWKRTMYMYRLMKQLLHSYPPKR